MSLLDKNHKLCLQVRIIIGVKDIHLDVLIDYPYEKGGNTLQ